MDAEKVGRAIGTALDVLGGLMGIFVVVVPILFVYAITRDVAPKQEAPMATELVRELNQLPKVMIKRTGPGEY